MISIIIPTYNEAENILRLIHHLKQYGNNTIAEIIVTDGGSNDNTVALALSAGAIAKVSPQKGRAAQMNFGASIATGTFFYFVHADTLPPKTYVSDIENAVKNGYAFGRYRTKFDSKKWILKVNAFFTRFDLFISNGGDQTLFMSKELFNAINGFNALMRIMEDYDIVTRAKQKATYKIIQKTVLISTRKYDTNTWWQVLKANYTIINMYKNGASQDAMANKYKAMLSYR